ncbi:MAG: HigA family addiction module antitoxin [Sphingomonadaceae bacterium]
MDMYNPPSPGDFIIESYLKPQGISGRECAGRMGITASTFQRILSGKGRIDAAMAQRLSSTLGRSAESWLAMQQGYDRWLIRQQAAGKVAEA